LSYWPTSGRVVGHGPHGRAGCKTQS